MDPSPKAQMTIARTQWKFNVVETKDIGTRYKVALD